MLNNAALDVVIGLVFIFLLYSLLATIIEEIVATFIGLRGAVLKMAIDRMLNDDVRTGGTAAAKMSEAFYQHPLIKYLRAESTSIRKRPAYINSETFSKVLIDLLRGQEVAPGDSFRPFIQKSLDEGKIAWAKGVSIEAETLSYLRSVWVDSHGDVDRFKEYVEQWFDEMMDRTTGWYKKYTQRILFGVGIVIAIFFNVDTIKITVKLQHDPKLREQVIAQATEFTKAHPNLDKELQDRKLAIDSLNTAALAKERDTTKKSALAKDKDSLNSNADEYYLKSRRLRDSLYNQATALVDNDIRKANNILAIGWEGGFLKNFGLYSLFGWVFTALAISLGAPFWFDLLNKLMKLRSSVAPDDDKKATTVSVKKTVRVG
ncbi:MAG TPA: hypothetical protein VK563_00030 [Puia sp.]|nr:hypothetical protein [Puia sp.]